LSLFKNNFPDRYFDVGIAEQHAVTFSAGLAKNGLIPVLAVYSTFFQRAYDQIIHDISLQNLKVIFALDRAGFVGNDGETHQGLFDIPMLLPIPNIKIYSPASGTELDACLKKAVNIEKCSVVIRYPKANSIKYSEYPFKNPELDWEIYNNMSSNLVITYGREIYEVLDAVKNINIDIIKLNLINSFDVELLSKIKEYSKIILVEECYNIGGIGQLLSDVLLKTGYSGEYSTVGVTNSFIKHADQSSSLKDSKLDKQSLSEYFQQVFYK